MVVGSRFVPHIKQRFICLLYLESVGLRHVWVQHRKLIRHWSMSCCTDQIWWNCMNLLWFGKAISTLHPSYLYLSSHTTSLFTVHNRKKRQYNNRLWIQLQSYSSHSPSLDQKKQPTPQKTTSSRWWFQKFVIFIPTKYLGKWFDFTNKMGGSTTNKSLYIPCFFFPQKSVPSADLGCRSQCLGAQERVVPQFWRQDRGVGCHATTLRTAQHSFLRGS